MCAKKLFKLFKFGKAGTNNKPATPPDKLWKLNQEDLMKYVWEECLLNKCQEDFNDQEKNDDIKDWLTNTNRSINDVPCPEYTFVSNDAKRKNRKQLLMKVLKDK